MKLPYAGMTRIRYEGFFSVSRSFRKHPRFMNAIETRSADAGEPWAVYATKPGALASC
jgi:hypothetical protein